MRQVGWSIIRMNVAVAVILLKIVEPTQSTRLKLVAAKIRQRKPGHKWTDWTQIGAVSVLIYEFILLSMHL